MAKQKQPIEETMRVIQHKGLREFFRKEHGFAQANPAKDRFVLRKGDTALDAWIAYFDGVVGRRPVALTRMLASEDQNAAYTVVTEFPEWLDMSYSPRREAAA